MNDYNIPMPLTLLRIHPRVSLSTPLASNPMASLCAVLSPRIVSKSSRVEVGCGGNGAVGRLLADLRSPGGYRRLRV